jgi:hypothetical protein
MEMSEIEIGSKWEDTLGVNVWDKNGAKIVKRGVRREVIITNKILNSIEYKDEKDYLSWISIEDFSRVENSNKRVRFEKVL